MDKNLYKIYEAYSLLNESTVTSINTKISAVNEIGTAFFIKNGANADLTDSSKWTGGLADPETRSVFARAYGAEHIAEAERLPVNVIAEINRAEEQARKMAMATLKVLGSRSIANVWWTNTPGRLAAAMKEANAGEISPANNPSDILIQFADGGVLGVSLKATKKNTNTDPTIANIGLGTFSKHWDLGLDKYVTTQKQTLRNDFDLKSTSAKAVKTQVRDRAETDPEFGKELKISANAIIELIRDHLYQQFIANPAKTKDWIIHEVLHDPQTANPQFISVLGAESNIRYYDPVNVLGKLTDKKTKIIVEPAGANTINIFIKTPNNEKYKLLSFRPKFDGGEVMSSNIKINVQLFNSTDLIEDVDIKY